MKSRTFLGEDRWEALQAFLAELSDQIEVCALGIWMSPQGEPVVYVEYTLL